MKLRKVNPEKSAPYLYAILSLIRLSFTEEEAQRYLDEPDVEKRKAIIKEVQERAKGRSL